MYELVVLARLKQHYEELDQILEDAQTGKIDLETASQRLNELQEDARKDKPEHESDPDGQDCQNIAARTRRCRSALTRFR